LLFPSQPCLNKRSPSRPRRRRWGLPCKRLLGTRLRFRRRHGLGWDLPSAVQLCSSPRDLPLLRSGLGTPAAIPDAPGSTPDWSLPWRSPCPCPPCRRPRRPFTTIRSRRLRPGWPCLGPFSSRGAPASGACAMAAGAPTWSWGSRRSPWSGSRAAPVMARPRLPPGASFPTASPGPMWRRQSWRVPEWEPWASAQAWRALFQRSSRARRMAE